MNTYKIVFAKNDIISCKKTAQKLVSDIPYYEHRNGQVTFALIKADSEEEATKIARTIVEEVKRSHHV